MISQKIMMVGLLVWNNVVNDSLLWIQTLIIETYIRSSSSLSSNEMPFHLSYIKSWRCSPSFLTSPITSCGKCDWSRVKR
jgi:hypothetical protein